MKELTTAYDARKYATLRAFLNDDKHKIIGLLGPFASGKSSACVIKLMERAATMPPMKDGIRRSRWIVVRNTFRELNDTTLKTFHQWFPPVHCGDYNVSNHTYMVRGMGDHGPFDAEFMFRALDRPDHISHLLSLEISGGWVNEAREVPWEIIKIIYGRSGRFPPKNEVGKYDKLLVLDTNPPDTESEWFEFFENKRPAIATIYKQPSARSRQAENLDNLQDDYYTDMLGLLSEDEIKVYIDGEYGFIKSGRPVYPSYRDSLHCKEFEFDKRLPIIRGWDFGLTPACIFLQVNPKCQVRVGHELCAERAGIEAFSDVVLRFCADTFGRGRTYTDIGDPAGDKDSETDETSCFDILHGKDIDIRGGPQAPQIRIESVDLTLRNMLDNGEPQMIVHPRCKMLRKGFQGGYQYRRLLVRDSGGGHRYDDKPEKNKYSHPHDALQYPVADMFADLLRDGRKFLGSGREREREVDDMQTTAISDFDPREV